MNDQIEIPCACNPCSGADCACGCQEATAGKSCGCGEQCRCGSECACATA
jgi:hypothetical protein